MNAARSLCVLQRRALRYFDRLDRRAHSLPSLPIAERRCLAAFCVIEIANAWAGFARSYYLSCLLRAQRVGGGRVYTTKHGINTPMEAIHEAVLLLTPKRATKTQQYHPAMEPKWHQRDTLMQLSTGLGFSNDAQVQLALNVSTDSFVDLVAFRNFFAHRSKNTYAAVRSIAPRYGQPASARPADVVSAYAYAGPQPVLVDWIDDIRLAVTDLCY
jgi:hypothetical protein